MCYQTSIWAKEHSRLLLTHLYTKCLVRKPWNWTYEAGVAGRWGAEGRGSGRGDILLYSQVPLRAEPHERMLPLQTFKLTFGKWGGRGIMYSPHGGAGMSPLVALKRCCAQPSTCMSMGPPAAPHQPVCQLAHVVPSSCPPG